MNADAMEPVRVMIAVARASPIEQIATIISRAWWAPCKRNDRGKMPMGDGLSRRIIARTGSLRSQ
jgi:hypothetical protein